MAAASGAPTAAGSDHAEPKSVRKPEPKLASAFVEGHCAVRAQREKRALHPMRQDRSTVLGFIEFRGDRPFRKYGRCDVTSYLDLTRRLPPNCRKPKRHKAMTLAEIADEANRKGLERRLSKRTVERHASALAQFFRYGFDKGQITLAAKDAMSADWRFHPETGPRQQRDVMTA